MTSLVSTWPRFITVSVWKLAGQRKSSGTYSGQDRCHSATSIHSDSGSINDRSIARGRYQTGNQAQEGGVQFDQVDFIEMFNLTSDNWQMENLWNVSSTKAAQAKLSTILHKWFQCKGDECM